MKRNLFKTWKSVFSSSVSLLLCAPFLSISSCSNWQSNEFDVVFEGDTNLATFLNTTAIIGQDYVSVIRFQKKYSYISNLIISCGEKTLTSEEFHYDNIRNELTIFGEYITQRSLKIQFLVEDTETIVEPEKVIDAMVALDTQSLDKKFISTATLGPFEYVNPKSPIDQLHLTVEEILPTPSPSTLGKTTVVMQWDELQPDSVFYISFNFEGDQSALIPGNIPPGSHQFHIKITCGEQNNRILLDSNDYYVNFNFTINDQAIDPVKKNIVVDTKYDEGSTPINCINMLPKTDETLFYLQNLPPEIQALPISELPLSMELNLIGTTIPTLHPQLLGDITNIGFTIDVSIKDWPGTYNAEIIFKYENEVIYDNNEFTVSFNSKIFDIKNKEATAVAQDFDTQSKLVRSKVTFGAPDDEFILWNYDYNKDDLEVIPLDNKTVKAVEGSGQVFLNKEKGTFSVSMEYYTPNFNSGHEENISFIIQSKDKTISQTFSDYKIKFESIVQWKDDIPETLTDTFLERSTQSVQDNTVGVIKLPTVIIYYPPTDVLENIAVVAEEVSDSNNNEPILGSLSVHDIKIHDYLEFDIFLEFDNINSFTLTTGSSTTKLNVSITVLESSIELKNQTLLIRPLHLFTPEENTFVINYHRMELIGFQCAYYAEGTEPTPIPDITDAIPLYPCVTFPEGSLFADHFLNTHIFLTVGSYAILMQFEMHMGDRIEEGHTESGIKISLKLKRVDGDIQIDFDKTITLVQGKWV